MQRCCWFVGWKMNSAAERKMQIFPYYRCEQQLWTCVLLQHVHQHFQETKQLTYTWVDSVAKETYNIVYFLSSGMRTDVVVNNVSLLKVNWAGTALRRAGPPSTPTSPASARQTSQTNRRRWVYLLKLGHFPQSDLCFSLSVGFSAEALEVFKHPIQRLQKLHPR